MHRDTLFRGRMKVPKEAWGCLLHAASQDSQEEQLVDTLPSLIVHWDKMVLHICSNHLQFT